MKPHKIYLLIFCLICIFAAYTYQIYYLKANPPLSQTPVGKQVSLEPSPASFAAQGTLARLEHEVAMAPQNMNLRWSLSDAYQKTGQLNKAALQLKTIAALAPKDLSSRLALTNTYVALRDFKAAEQLSRDCIKLAPAHSEAWSNLASSLYHQKRFFESLEAARKAMLLAPKNTNADIVLASAALDFATQFPGPHKTKSKELFEAKKHFEKALKRLPQQGELHLRLGLTQLALQEASGALKSLQRATELMPNRKEPIVLLGRALMMNNQREKAKEHAEAALSRFPDEAEFYSILSRVWRGKDSEGPQKSYEFIRKAVELAPENADYQETLGLAALRVKKLEEARVAFEQARQLNPYSRVPYLQLSAINNQLGQGKDATEHAKKLATTNQNEEDLRKWERLAERFPQNAPVRATLADWYLNRGFVSAARDTYIQALRLEPGNKRIKARLTAVQNQLKIK